MALRGGKRGPHALNFAWTFCRLAHKLGLGAINVKEAVQHATRQQLERHPQQLIALMSNAAAQAQT